MKSPAHWKDHYVLETDAEEIEKSLRVTTFASGGRDFELSYFECDKDTPNILVSQGPALVLSDSGRRFAGDGSSCARATLSEAPHPEEGERNGEVAAAHACIEGRQAFGRVLVTP